MTGSSNGYRCQIKAIFKYLPATLVCLWIVGVIYSCTITGPSDRRPHFIILPISNLQDHTPRTAITKDLKVKSDSNSSTKCENCSVPDELKKLYSVLYEYRQLRKVNKNLVKKPICPAIPPKLVGPIKVFHDYFTMGNLSALGFHLSPGGSYVPTECIARQKVAIIIPYRNREKHLSTLLLNLHPFLQKQQLEYTIFVVNQIPGSKFNRGMLMNVGFVEAEKRKKYDCVIFHDVDLMPENDRNIYNCPEDAPRHMSVAVDKFNYKLPYKFIMGGIVAIRWNLFVKTNGYSNQFFGWGGEDDDLSGRCRQVGLSITRYPASIARYTMIRHGRDPGNEKNPQRFKLLKSTDRRQWRDGLNTMKYTLKSIEDKPLFTLINVNINQAQVMNAEARTREKFPFELESKS